MGSQVSCQANINLIGQASGHLGGQVNCQVSGQVRQACSSHCNLDLLKSEENASNTYPGVN